MMIESSGKAGVYAYTAALHGPRLHPALARLAIVVLWLGGIGAILATGAQVVAQLDDARQVNHVVGAWTALTAYVVEEGILYPPLHDAATGRYGGTRFAPLAILVNAAAAGVTGEYVLSGKAVSAVAMVGLLLLLFLALRRAGCPPAVACGLVGCVILTHTALRGAMQIRGDTIPCALQLGAMLLMWGGTEGHPEHQAERRRSRRARLHLAAVLCALAVAFKLSAIWGTCAIGLWLLVTDRRQLAVFCAIWWIVLPSIAIGFQFATDGRMLESMFGLTTAGLADASGGRFRGPYELVRFTFHFAQSVWPLLPLVVMSILTAGVRRIVEPATIALACATGVLLLVLSDSGAQYNHLLDMVVLAPIAVGWLWRRAAIDEGLSVGQGVIAAVIAASIATGFMSHLPHPYRSAGPTDADAYTCDDAMAPLRCALDGKSLLSEDPYVPVSMGRIPVVLDPWMLQRIGAAHPDAVEPLVQRIHAHEFDALVLFRPLVAGGELDPWYRRNHFGAAVAEAMASAYRLDREILGYQIYVPRRGAP